MLHAEKTAGKAPSGKYKWSPTLKKAVQAYRYWRLKLKQSRGQTISSTVLQQLRQTSDIQDSSDEPIPQKLAAKHLKCAYRTM
ncbi:MAG: hypothetical protein ACK53Y_02580, partial [bacterium]